MFRKTDTTSYSEKKFHHKKFFWDKGAIEDEKEIIHRNYSLRISVKDTFPSGRNLSSHDS